MKRISCGILALTTIATCTLAAERECRFALDYRPEVLQTRSDLSQQFFDNYLYWESKYLRDVAID